MPTKFKQLIEAYCDLHSIQVPIGFARRNANRYVVILTHVTPPKLVAKTWFNMEDVVYHIEHILLAELGKNLNSAIRILDFKDWDELEYTGGKRLDRVAKFSIPNDHESE